MTRPRALRALRLGLAALLALGLGAAGAACPSRDLVVQLSSDGADTVVSACETFPNACNEKTGACQLNRLLCDQTKCILKDACQISDDNPPWTPEQSMGIRLLLLQITPDSVTIENPNQLQCVPLNLRPCIFDATGKFGCTAPVVDQDACITAALSAAVDNALGSGLSFAGFTSTSDVSLVVAFYHKPGDEKTCESSVLVNPTDCATANLSAVAGLSDLSGGSTFDITCASCQNGTRGSQGPDNGPCPDLPPDGDGGKGTCFLQRVAQALVDAGL